MLMRQAADSALYRDTEIAESLFSEGWAVADNFISKRMAEELRREIDLLDSQNQLKPAQIGHENTQKLDTERRSDRIYWLQPTACPIVMRRYFHRMEELRLAINREFMIGLFELEAHATVFDPGKHYEKHLDCFQDDDSRLVTAVLYLNKDWKNEDGGALRIYLDADDDTQYRDIQPVAGRLVTFLSNEFYHQVLPTQRRRISLTGCYRAAAKR